MTRVQVPAAVRPVLQAVGRTAASLRARAYAVGGCVRDWLLALPTIEDLDVTVEGDGLGVAQAAAQALGGGGVVFHAQFGTATVRVPRAGGALRVDVATCRKETYAKPAAYPKVAPGRLMDDLARRDFSINAMALDLDAARFGELIDPFGGAADLQTRLLRVLHSRSFLDDPSRLLRGVRLATRFRLAWEPDTAAAAAAAVRAGALGWLNAGRVRKELERLAGELDPAACARALARLLEV